MLGRKTKWSEDTVKVLKMIMQGSRKTEMGRREEMAENVKEEI